MPQRRRSASTARADGQEQGVSIELIARQLALMSALDGGEQTADNWWISNVVVQRGHRTCHVNSPTATTFVIYKDNGSEINETKN